MSRTQAWIGPFAAALCVVAVLMFASEGRGADYNTSIDLGRSIGGVALGTSRAAVEHFLGYRGRRSSTRTSDRKGAVDETYGYLRVTYVPCRAGGCVAAVATSSPAFRTRRGVHVQSPITALLKAYPSRRCGQLPKSSDVSRPDGFCKLGFAASGSGTAFLTIEEVSSHQRAVKTIAVAEAATRWNINPAAGIVGPTRQGRSSTRAVLILAAIFLLLFFPIARLLWRLKQGDELDAGGSDGRQLFKRRKRRKWPKHA